MRPGWRRRKRHRAQWRKRLRTEAPSRPSCRGPERHDRLIVGAVHEDEAALLESKTQAGTADDEDLRTLLKLFSHDRCDVHRGGHDHVRGRREVHGVELVGDLLGGAHRVVGDKSRGHAGLTRLKHRRRGVLNRLVTGPRRAVKVEQRAVVFFSERRAGATQRRALTIHVGISVQSDIDNLRVLDLCGHRRDDLCCFVFTAEIEQALCLDFHQAATQFVVCRSRQGCECIVDDHEAYLGLAEIRAGAGRDEDELDLLCELEGRGIGRVDDLNGLFRMAKTALGVSFHSSQRRIAAHTTNSAHLAQGLLVAARRIGGERSCLAHHIDTACARDGGLRVLVGSLGVKIDQLAGHHQVTSDNVTIRARQRR